MLRVKTAFTKLLRWPPFLSLNFEPVTESLFRVCHISQNHKQGAIAWFIGAMLLDSFVVSDYFVARPYFYLLASARCLILTPIILLVSWLMWRKKGHYDLLTILPPVLISVILSSCLVFTQGAFRERYTFCLVMLIMGGSMLGRPRTGYATVSAILQFVVYVAMLQKMDFVTGLDAVPSVLLCLSGGVVSVFTAYVLEQSGRRSFVMQRRIELLNGELEAQSLTDPLTRLANRRSFDQVTARHWSDLAGHAEPVSMVLIDIDHFKMFNDTFGHAAGDGCLVRIAKRIKAEMPPRNGLAVRFGGEEMLLFLPAMDLKEATGVAERIRLALLREAIPHASASGRPVVSASFGVAAATSGDCTPAELVMQADVALYAAKRNGRNQVWPPLALAASEASDCTPARAA